MREPTNEQAPCIVCGTIPDSASNTDWHPHRATEFVSYGHYGSTVFDPMDDDLTLFINVCDSCLTVHQGRVHERETVRPHPVYEVRNWTSPHAPGTPEGTTP